MPHRKVELNMNERGEEIDSATLFGNILDNSSGPDEPFRLRELSVLKTLSMEKSTCDNDIPCSTRGLQYGM